MAQPQPSAPPDEDTTCRRSIWSLLGPGFVTGSSDDDPSGIATYASAGAQFGYGMLWVMFVTVPMMIAVQFISARIGLAARMGIGSVIRKNYPRWVLLSVVGVLAVANTINAGADLGAIAEAVRLLVPIPAVPLVLLASVLIIVLVTVCSYRAVESVFKWLALALLAYVGSAFFSRPDLRAVFHGTFVPTLQFNKDFLVMLTAILGTTITPFLFFWQADVEVEELRQGEETVRSNAEELGATRNRLTDVVVGMVFSNVVSYFIILSTAATLHAAGKTDINSATEAAAALRPIAGRGAELLLALGLIGSGFLAVPVLVGSTAYAVSQAIGLKSGLDRKARQAPEFYVVIALCTLLGMLLNLVGLNPVKALLYAALINGLLTPPVLLLLMLIANNPRIMGHHVNGPWLNLFGWLTTIAMTLSAIGAIVSFAHP